MTKLLKKLRMKLTLKRNNICFCKKSNSSHLTQNKLLINLKWTLRREKPIQVRGHNFISKSQREKKEKTKKMKLLQLNKMYKKQKLKKCLSKKKLFLKYLRIQTYRFLLEALIFTYNYFSIKC
jgi:hypothetical protein